MNLRDIVDVVCLALQAVGEVFGWLMAGLLVHVWCGGELSGGVLILYTVVALLVFVLLRVRISFGG